MVFKGEEDTAPKLSLQDVTVASLKAIMAELETQIESLSVRATVASQKAKEAVTDKNRAIAVSALKSKKFLEQTITQRDEMLSKLQYTYNKLEQATDQVAMIRVVVASTDVLRNLHKESGGIRKVEEVIDNLRDEAQKVDEVSSAMQAAGQEAVAADDSLIEEELESLLQESQWQAGNGQAPNQHDHREELLSLPKVPSEDLKVDENAVNHVSSENFDRATDVLERVSLD